MLKMATGEDTDMKCADTEAKDMVIKDEPLSHQDALTAVEEGIADIIESDPLLSYLPSKVTLEELNSLLALEHGRAMTVQVRRADGDLYSVVIEQNATVRDLKKTIQRHITTKQHREGRGRSISWRYVWKTYWLYFQGQKLSNDYSSLKDYGITNNSEITFLKRLRAK